jgi:hypothetical protein
MAVKVGQAGGDDGLRHRLAAMTTHRLCLAVDHHGKTTRPAERQAAVKSIQFAVERLGASDSAVTESGRPFGRYAGQGPGDEQTS